MTHEFLIEGYRLQLTCFACPEQYDVFMGEQQVAYLRLRHGTFRADVPDCGGETVYSDHPTGDGIFNDNERMYYLRAAINAIQEYYANLAFKQEREYYDNESVGTDNPVSE